MALADYYRRDAVAISQIIAGYDEAAIADRLNKTKLAITYSRMASQTNEGRFLLELLVMLTARLYPSLTILPHAVSDDLRSSLSALALAINPRIELDPPDEPNLAIGVGRGIRRAADLMIYAGSAGWDALVSAGHSVPVGDSLNPFGAGAAACIAAANAFRYVFSVDAGSEFDLNLRFPTITGKRRFSPELAGLDVGEVVLVGLGAVGNAAVWALAKAKLAGRMHVVDAEHVDLGNLQRYVLTERTDEGASKVGVAARHLTDGLTVIEHKESWQQFVATEGTTWATVLVAVDSARDRRAIQASLPHWIANAWTQPGDLGISTHDFTGSGPCLYCLYLPASVEASEDLVYAQALGVPDQLMRIRELLYRNQGAPSELLQLVAERLGVDSGRVMAFVGQPIQTIYREGVCGGAILPIGSAGSPRPEVHVPVAHQSALAGVLLGARLASRSRAATPDSFITRVNVMRAIDPRFLSQAAAKDPRGICVCQDADYVKAFRSKYSVA